MDDDIYNYTADENKTREVLAENDWNSTSDRLSKVN